MRRYVMSYPDCCTGCRVCELACSMAHDGVFNPEKARITIHTSSLDRMEKALVCIHCEKPQCMDVCPVEAISRDPEGGVVSVDAENCTGCGDCVVACPFDAMKLHPDTGKAINCDLCGGDPLCVAYCRPGALRFGGGNHG